MAKKMKTLFKHKNPSQQPSVSSSSSQSRVQPKTHSFLAAAHTATADHPSSTLTQFSGDEAADDLESAVIRGVRTIKSSERLFFSPEKTNSILKTTSKSEHHRKLLISTTSTPQPENHDTINISKPMMIRTRTLESLDPYTDFRSSMEEMVEAHRLHDWDLLEELLGCYLMLNDKRNHGHIIRAFVDLVLLIKSSHFALHQLTTTNSSDLASDSFVTSFSSPLHLSCTSTNAETSCSSSSIAPAEAGSQ